MLEVVLLQRLQLAPHLGREALAALAPVEQEGLKIQTRVFAMSPEVAQTVDDARILSRGGYGPQVDGQRREPLERSVVQCSIVGVTRTAHGLPIGSRAAVGSRPWGGLDGAWGGFSGRKNGLACEEHRSA